MRLAKNIANYTILKRCSGCKFEKDINEFFTSSIQSDGFQSYCKECNRISSKKWYRQSDKNKQSNQSRKYLLKSKYGLTLDEYNNLLEKQNGVCAICKKPETQCSYKEKIDSLRVDHCHTTNIIRGLLCSKCNLGISQFDDKMSLLMSAMEYLLDFHQKLEEMARKK